MKEIEFERVNYIKNIYSSEYYLNRYNWIIFESLKGFIRSYEEKYLGINNGKLIEIRVNSIEEYKAITELFTKTKLNDVNEMFLTIYDPDVLDEVMRSLVPGRYVIMTKFENEINLGYYWNISSDCENWISSNRFIKELTINKDNYNYIINDLLNCFNTTFVKFYAIHFDYESFEELKFKELHKLKFWLFELKKWMGQSDKQRIEVVHCNKLMKFIYVTDDMILYLNDKKDPIWSWDLKKYKGKTGEDIDYKELNWLGTYEDLIEKAMYNTYFMVNWYYVDYLQNLKVMESINQVPDISNYIQRWLYSD